MKIIKILGFVLLLISLSCVGATLPSLGQPVPKPTSYVGRPGVSPLTISCGPGFIGICCFDHSNAVNLGGIYIPRGVVWLKEPAGLTDCSGIYTVPTLAQCENTDQSCGD